MENEVKFPQLVKPGTKVTKPIKREGSPIQPVVQKPPQLPEIPENIKKYIDIKLGMLAKSLVDFVDGPAAQKMMGWITQVFAPAFANELINQLYNDGTVQTETPPDGAVPGLQEQAPQA